MPDKPSKTVDFTDKNLKQIAAHPDGEYYTDSDTQGLTARAAKNHLVTFTVTARVKGTRVPHTIGVYAPHELTAKTIKEIRQAAKDKKTDWRRVGVDPKATKSVKEYIAYYTDERNVGNIKPEKGGVAQDWKTQVEKLERMFKPLMPILISDLTDTEIKKYKAKHLHELARKRDGVINDKPLRQAMSALRQVLEQAVKEGFLPFSILEACKTGKYKKRPRYLLPGEWQRTATVLDYLPDDGGLLPRFLLATAARLNTALNMKWSDLSEPPKREWHKVMPVTKWHARVKGKRTVTLYLTGEPLRIIKHFAEQKADSERRHKENAKRKPEGKDEYYAFREAAADAKRETVFTKRVITMWRKHGPFFQRKIEEKIETVPFTRQDLRRTLATYLKYAGGSQSTAAVALTHSFGVSNSRQDKAPGVTGVYTKDDRGVGDLLAEANLGTGNLGVIYNVVSAHAQTQAIFKQMEMGERSQAVEDIEDQLSNEGANLAAMLVDKEVDKEFQWVKSAADHAAWVKKAKLAEWGAQLKVTLLAKLAAESKKTRARKIAKQKATALRVEKSGSTVAAA